MQDDINNEFNDVAAIDVACALQEMIGVDVSPSELRDHYTNASDDMIVRIVDTLHIYRFDWMNDAKKSLTELLERLAPELHVQVLEEAQDLALMRLKHIGFLQQSGQYLKDLEEDILREGKDRFPELYDASHAAEQKSRETLFVVIPMLQDLKEKLELEAKNDNENQQRKQNIMRATLYGPTLYG
jgi:hypothetical protein